MIPNAEFFTIVISALKARQAFSAVRMSDGEREILKFCRTRNPSSILTRFEPEWNRRFGTVGITCGEIEHRLITAFNGCTYFCTSSHVDELLPRHKNQFADKSYSYEWTRANRATLLNEAGRVVVINREAAVAACIGSREFTTAEIIHVPLSNWTESESVRHAVEKINAPLVLLSGGPASKYLAPVLAASGSRMVLDIGQGADAWWMLTGLEYRK